MNLKPIAYPGIRFHIPDHWLEDYDQNGGSFYASGEEAGTLRINVMTMEAPPGLQGPLAQEALLSIPGIRQEDIELMPGQHYLARSIEPSQEQGQDIILYWWYVCREVAANTVRMANISYTILSTREQHSETEKDLQFIAEQLNQEVLPVEE